MSISIPECIKLIHQRLSNFSEITYEELMFISSIVKIENLEAGEFFIRPGDSSQKVAFVLKGLTKTYYIFEEDEGAEHISHFGAEGSFIGCYTDLLRKVPSSGYVEAIESCSLLVMNYEEMYEATKNNLAWVHLNRKIAEQRFIFYSDRMKNFSLKTAKEKYETFKEMNPNLVNRLPLNQIAIYLNITPATLSRLRNSSGNYKK